MSFIRSLIVPGWYLDAREKGASEEELKRRIVESCLESASRRGLTPPELTPDAVTLTYDAYEYTLLKEGK